MLLADCKRQAECIDRERTTVWQAAGMKLE